MCTLRDPSASPALPPHPSAPLRALSAPPLGTSPRRPPQAKVKLLAEYLNIQVDNPCVVLTQSVSSAFLRNSKNGELLYQFFLLASGLQPLRITYREAQKQAHCLRIASAPRPPPPPPLHCLRTASAPPLQVEDARVKLDAHQAQKPKLQEAVAAKEKLVQEARQREDATAQLAQLDHQIALGQAEEREKALERRGRQAEAAARAETDSGEALVAAEKAQEELRRRNEAQLKQAEEQKAEQCASEMRLRDTTKALKAKQRDVKQLETQKKELAERVEDAAATLRQAQAQKATKVAAQRNEERRANEQLARQQEQLSKTAASKKAFLAEAERELSAAKQKQQALQAAATKEGHARAQAQRVAREAELELQNKLAARDKNALIKYGAGMDEFIAEVARVKTWKAGPPVGPLGQHVRLKPEHERFRLAVENALGRWHTLAGMAVGCFEDEKKLRAILAKYGALKSVPVRVQAREARFQPQLEAWWSKLPKDVKAVSLYEAIEITDDQTHNALLNTTGAENVMMLADYAAVKKVIFAPGAPNRKAYTPDGAQHFRRGQGTEGTEHNGQRVPQGLMAGQDLRDVVNGLEQEKKRTAEAAKEAQATEAAAKETEAAAQKTLTQLSKYRDAAAAAHRGADRDRRELEAAAEAGSHEHGVRQAQEDVEAAEEEEARVAREVEEVEAKRQRASGGLLPLQRAHAEAEEAQRALVDNAAAACDPGGGGGEGGKRKPAAGDVEAQLREAQRRVKLARTAQQNAKAQSEAAVGELTAARQEAAQLREAVRTRFGEADGALFGGARSGGAAPSLDELQRRHKKLTREHAHADRSLRASGAFMSLAGLEAALQEAADAIEAHCKLERYCANTHAEIERGMKSRYKEWTRSLKRCAKQCDADFTRHLSYKGLGGDLNFDHNKEQLTPRVSTSSQDKSAHATTNVKSLSGGEQAFTTLSLALAMWQFSQSPVRAMDEVDKNMDATFLRATLQLLIELFASQRSRQFLILTPLDYATPLAALGVTPEEAKRRDIRFLRLRAPRDNASQAGASQAP
jgi:chromosome segregation ATPase